MNFSEIAQNRQSCRNYDAGKMVEQEKLDKILETARLSPSACNGQPYLITVCRGDAAKEVARATMGMGMNKLAAAAPVVDIYNRRCSAIRTEKGRGTITESFAKMATKLAKEYKFRALQNSDYANKQYALDMSREKLYAETDRRLK